MHRFHLWSLVFSYASASLVTNLTSATFQSFIDSNGLSLISFVVPWCEFCHDLYPEYEAAADALQPHDWPLARVNCETDKELCREYKIPIYPTIRVFHGEEHSIYNGKRRADAIVSFMKRHSYPIATRLETAQQAAEFSVKDQVTFLGYFEEYDTSSAEAFKAVAEKYRDEYLFGFTSDESFGSAEKIQKPAIVQYKTFDEGRMVYEGRFEPQDIRAFVMSAGKPHIREIGIDLHYASSERIPMAVILAAEREQREQLKRALWPVAHSSQNDLLWIIVDPEKHPEYASRLELTTGDWPAFGIEDSPNNFRYSHPKGGSVAELNQAAIRLVIDDFLNKRLQSSSSLPLEPTDSQFPERVDKLDGESSAQDSLSDLKWVSGGASKVPRDEL